MLFIFFVFLTTVFASSYEKYIELLPEEEKQAFLEKIARRIMENIQSKENKEKFSRELSDDQLKEHNDFVESILKEETEQMIKNKQDDDTSKESSNTDDNVEEKASKIDDRADIPDEEQVDFTVNAKRRSSDNEEVTEDKSTEKNSTVAEDIPMQKRSIKTDVSDSEKESANETSADENLSATELSDASRDVTTVKELELMETTSSQDLITKENNYTQSANESDDEVLNNTKSSSEETKLGTEKPTTSAFVEDIKSNEDEPSNTKMFSEENNSTTVTSQEISKDSIQTTSTTESEILTQVNNSEAELTENKDFNFNTSIKTDTNITLLNKNITGEEINSEESDNNDELTTPDDLDNTRNTTLSSVLTDEGTAELILTTYKPTNIPTNSVDENTNTKVEEITEISPEVTTENARSLTKTTTGFEALTAINIEFPNMNQSTSISTETDVNSKSTTTANSLVTTTNIPVFTPADINENTSTPKTKSNSLKTQENIRNSTTINKAIGHAISTLKNNVKRLKSKIEKHKKDDIKSIIQEVIDHNQYQVYEIPENQAPFVRTPPKSIEQPQYVPVYDYSPNKAFYNPKNRLGPNLVEENSIEIGTENLRHRENKELIFSLDYFDLIKSQEKEHKSTKKKQKPTFKDVLEIKNKQNLKELSFPNFETSVYTIDDSLKNKIRDVRTAIFFEQQLFSKNNKELKDSDDNFSKENSSVNAHSDNFIIVNPSRTNVKKENKPLLMNILEINKSLKPDIYSKTDGKVLKVEHPKKKNVTKPGIMKEVHKEKKIAGYYDTIREILQITDESDVFPMLDRLQEMGFPIARRTDDFKTGSYMSVLKDMLREDSKGLKQYDWLATTVEIHSAILKIQELIKRNRDGQPIHPSDIQILKYLAFLHNFATQFTQANNIRNKLRKKYLLPRNKNKNKNKVLKEKGLYHRPWLYLRKLLPDLTDKDKLVKLEEFTMDVEDQLYDLHNALKSIAQITKFKHQDWFGNLKDLYLTAEEKHLRELLLHMSFTKLVELIEHSCKNGLEEDFIVYMKKNRKEAKRTLEEMIFVMKLVNEAKHLE